MSLDSPLHYMTLALQLAERGRGFVAPNPMVGCVIVNDAEIVGTGYHQRAGEAHAEVYALQAAGSRAKGATLYVTLEPCSHQGKTPPCVTAIIAAGVKTVVVACLDPNPLVAGKGVEALKKAGIAVEIGLCAAAAQKLNAIFFHFITTQRPFVLLKWAMSLDGKTVTHQADDKQISAVASQQHLHALRHTVDAILVGANTAQLDDPELTVRFPSDSSLQVKHPLRIVLAGSTPLRLDLKLFNGSLPGQTVVAATNNANQDWLNALRAMNIEIMLLPANACGQVDLPALLSALGKKQITSLLVEGGMQTHQAFMRENLVNQVCCYLANTVIGDLKQKHKIAELQAEQLGNNFYLTGIW